MSKEVKFHQTNIFLTDCDFLKEAFTPTICLATQALGSAGWDSTQVRQMCLLIFHPMSSR